MPKLTKLEEAAEEDLKKSVLEEEIVGKGKEGGEENNTDDNVPTDVIGETNSGSEGKLLESNNNVSDLQRQIIEQVEYYFGNINLPRDRFLQEEIKKDDGWISLTTMLKFRRLVQICSDPNVIAESLKRSNLIQVSEDGSKIRRNPGTPLPENSLEYWQIVKRRTVFIKGFEQDTKLDDILNFVRQFGEVENVMMRREKSEKRAFKGSVFVTYKDQEKAEAFVNNDTKEFNGNEILKMMQNDFWAKKQKELREKRLAARAAKRAKKAVKVEVKKKGLDTVHFVKGLVLSVENIPKEDCDLMKIKEFFKQYGDVQYVVYETGDEKAQIRFGGDENGASVAWEKAIERGEDGKVIFGGNELKGTVLEGQEEEEYWNNFSRKKADKQTRMAKKRQNKIRGHRERFDIWYGGTKGEKRLAKRSVNEGEEPQKKSKRTVFPDDNS